MVAVEPLNQWFPPERRRPGGRVLPFGDVSGRHALAVGAGEEATAFDKSADECHTAHGTAPQTEFSRPKCQG